ncbi:MAG: hypothetical protein WKF94_03130 [Solirubrobacteraceae bacterium]
MFERPLQADHDTVVAGTIDAIAATTSEDVAAAFLTSLRTRRLDLRSALGSFALGRHLTPHSFESSREGPWCAVCGHPETRAIDRNILNFERFKWGGVRRDDLAYVWLDLMLFCEEEHPTADAVDRTFVGELLSEFERADPALTASAAGQELLRRVKGNKDERDVLIGILGVCSVLETTKHRGYKDRFVPYRDRELPSRRYVDQVYPACWWTASEGVNRDAASEFLLL